MNWAQVDLREDILRLFVEVQEPWQPQLVDEIIRLVGCQRLKDTVAKRNWAATNKEKQRLYVARYHARNKEKRSAAQRARRKRKLEEQDENPRTQG